MKFNLLLDKIAHKRPLKLLLFCASHLKIAPTYNRNINIQFSGTNTYGLPYVVYLQ